MKFILYSIFLFFLSPCNHPKSLSAANSVTDNSSIVITYRQTACFGKCPVASMTINGSTKTITYSGQMNVEKQGKYSKAISNEELDKLVAAFAKAKFETLNEKYMGQISDFPSVIITFTKDGKTKSVEDRKAGPAELVDLENLLKDIADSSGWKKEEDADH